MPHVFAKRLLSRRAIVSVRRKGSGFEDPATAAAARLLRSGDLLRRIDQLLLGFLRFGDTAVDRRLPVRVRNGGSPRGFVQLQRVGWTVHALQINAASGHLRKQALLLSRT